MFRRFAGQSPSPLLLPESIGIVPECFELYLSSADRQIHSPLHVHAALLSPDKSLTYTLLPRLATRNWPHYLNFPKPIANPSPHPETAKLLYVQLIQTSGYNTRAASKSSTGRSAIVRVTGANGEKAILGEGDGVFVEGGVTGEEVKVENVGAERAEVLVFEMDK